MKIHEYQAKQLLRDAGVAVPDGIVATTPDEASAAFKQLGGPLAVVKAQIHAGGRGKGTITDNPKQHGVQLVRSAGEAASAAGALLDHKLVTIQTGPEGQTVRRVLVEAGCEIARELYLGIVIDRAAGLPVLMASQRRRHEHRRRRRKNARADFQGNVLPRRRPAVVPGPQAVPPNSNSPAPAFARPRSS